MPRITDEKVEEVRAASDLVEVVSDFVRLKKQGGRFVGLCPFHNEKSPSFSVDPGQGLYFCFGCRRGGDVFKFLQEKEGVGFLDAVRLLAERGGIELPEEGGASAEADEREAILAALRSAARFFYKQLATPEGQRGVEYLRERGFTKETVKAFGLGYAPDAWDVLVRAATAEGFKPEILEAAGLALPNQKGDGWHDRYRDRLIFPILSPVGKVLGFGGRLVPGGKPAQGDYEPPKYINSPETRVYRKSEVLYGLKQAKTQIRAEEEAVLVEGYADVVSLHQAGVQNVVAASGTALTEGQVRLLKQYARTVVLLFDADAAGQSAALRSIELVLDGGLGAYAVTLPDGADPDSFVRQFGGEAFQNYLRRERRDFVTFLTDHARRTGAMDTPERKADAARQLLDAVARVQDEVAREEYLLRAATALGVPDATLRSRLREQQRARREPSREAVVTDVRRASGREAPDEEPADATSPPPVAKRPEEEQLLRLMLEHGEPMVEHVLTRTGLDEFSEGPMREAVGHLVRQYEAGAVDAEPFRRGDFGDDVQRLASEVLADRDTPSANWRSRVGVAVPALNARPFEAASGAMRLLKLDRVEEALAEVQRRIFLAEQEGSDLDGLLQEQQGLLALRAHIERGAFLEPSAG